MATPTLDWNLLKSFLAVVETGSLSAAARRLASSQPTIGRHVKELELALGLKLFIRRQHGLEPTDQGQELARRAQAIGATVVDFTRGAAGLSEQVIGTVRLTATEHIAHHLLPSALGALRRAEPEIEIELVVDNSSKSLSRREADIAIRQFQPPEEDLTSRRLGQLELGIYATREFLARLGPIDLAALIAGHHLIGSETNVLPPEVSAQIGPALTRKAFWFRCDSLLTQRAMMRAGLGIASEIVVIARREPDLVRLFETIRIPPIELWLVIHRDLMNSRLARTVYRSLEKNLLATLAELHGDQP